VVLGSCIVSWLFAQILFVQVPVFSYVSLGVGVWLVYTIDHLIDAHKINHEAITARHQFHQNHFVLLLFVWISIFIITVPLALYYLPTSTIYLGIIVAVIVVVHLILVFLLGGKVSNFIQKELGVGLGYTLGVVIAPLSLSHTYSLYFVTSLLQLFCIAMINIYTFSFFDIEKDKHQGHTSIARNIGRQQANQLLNGLIIITGILILISTTLYPNMILYQLVFIIMYLPFVLIKVQQKYFKKQDNYRVLGDMVFLFPIFLCLF